VGFDVICHRHDKCDILYQIESIPQGGKWVELFISGVIVSLF
jgi:hypothetical protein